MNNELNTTKEQNSEQKNNLNSNHNVRNSNPNLFSTDFLYFKNDILRELKEINNKFENQKRLNTHIKDLISSQDINLVKYNNKLENISNILNDKKAKTDYDTEKIKELIDFKTKIESDLAAFDCKIKLNSEELKCAINKYDKVISDNLVLPGIVGKDTKFKDCRDLFEYILNQIKIFSSYKDRNSIDLKTYKTKLDSLVNSLNYQISSITGNANSFTTANMKIVEKKCLDEIKSFNDKVMKIRVDTLEMVQNFQKEKNQMFEEWGNLKNTKQELIELVESSIKKVNISNNQMKKTIDNFEKQFNEVKNSMNELYEKMKIENNNYKQVKEDKKDLKINNEKIDYNLPSSNSEINGKNINNAVKRIQSSKTVLQNYIEGNSVYKELLQQNSLRCKKHNSSEESVNIIMRKYYDEGFYTIKDKNIYRTIENKYRKHNSPLTEKNKFNNTMNTTPKTNFNLNKMVSYAHKQEKSNHGKSHSPHDSLGNKYLDCYNMNDIDAKNTIQYINKNRKHSFKKGKILIKEGSNENNTTNNNDRRNSKIKLKEAEKRLKEKNKFTELFIDKRKMFNIKQLNSLSVLYEDIKKHKYPKLDKNENNKDDETFTKNININKKVKNKMNNTFLKEYNVLSSFRVRNNNANNNKLRQRINSSEYIKRNNFNENEKDNSSSFINMISDYMSEKDKKMNIKVNKDLLIKKAIYKLKNEKHK